jgi:EAL domain-containing protein (putative c-di-GMP-specific phosphodiesterase class I)
LGGDEFAVLLSDVMGDPVPAQVEQALRIMRAAFDYDGHTLDTQATAGLAFYPTHGTSSEDLLKAADIALYAGKTSQRGALSIFEPSMRAGLQRRASMLNVARIAVRDKLVVPHYQPKVELVTRQIAGFEALLRWQHRTLGLQSPATISAAFDDTNLAIELGDQMRMTIAQDLRHWLNLGLKPGRIAINLAPAEFRYEQLAPRVLAPFERLNVPLEALEIEITETVLLGRDSDNVARTLACFRDQGVRIALDDFGTGYASLTHLKTFPVDVIKIDRSFVTSLRPESNDAAIVDAVVSLAKRLGMEVVAEGVEQLEQLHYLNAQGCEYGQGFLFGRAMPAEQVELLLSGRSLMFGPERMLSQAR